MTDPLKRVLGAFLADPTARRYGYDLMKAARLPSGALYPMLARLQDEGLSPPHGSNTPLTPDARPESTTSSPARVPGSPGSNWPAAPSRGPTSPAPTGPHMRPGR